MVVRVVVLMVVVLMVVVLMLVTVVMLVVMLVLQASQFCRHNLFSLNTVMVKLNDLWWRRWGTVRQCSAWSA